MKTFENNELNIAVFEGSYGSAYWDEIIKRFEDAYPGVLSICRSAEIGDIIRPQIVAGNVPDFISMNDNDSTGLISSMVKEHATVDLSDVFGRAALMMTHPLKDQVIDGLLDSPSALLTATADPLPRLMPTRWVWFTTRLIRRERLGTPVTWDDFFELGDEARRKGYALFTYQGIYPGYLESMLGRIGCHQHRQHEGNRPPTPGSLSSGGALKVFRTWQRSAPMATDGWHRCSEPYRAGLT